MFSIRSSDSFYLNWTLSGYLCHEFCVFDVFLLTSRVQSTVPSHRYLKQNHRRSEIKNINFFNENLFIRIRVVIVGLDYVTLFCNKGLGEGKNNNSSFHFQGLSSFYFTFVLYSAIFSFDMIDQNRNNPEWNVCKTNVPLNIDLTIFWSI